VPAVLNPYLGFRDNARAAMEFYQSVFGGELRISTFAELGGGGQDPADGDKIMHAQLETESGLHLMGSDTPASMDYVPGDNYSVSLSGGPDADEELRRYWDGLSAGGTVLEPLTTAPWGDAFGMCIDKFGVRWLVNIGAAQA